MVMAKLFGNQHHNNTPVGGRLVRRVTSEVQEIISFFKLKSVSNSAFSANIQSFEFVFRIPDDGSPVR